MASDGRRQFLHQLGVIPTHKDLFGCEAALDDLLSLLRRYPVTEWLE